MSEDLDVMHRTLKARVDLSFDAFLAYFKEYEVFILKHKDYKFKDHVVEYKKDIVKKKRY